MTEVENEGVIEQEAATPVETTESQPPVAEQPKTPEVGSKDYNWRRMEGELQEERNARIAAERKNQELETTLDNAQTPKIQEYEDEFSQLQKDDLITVAQSDERGVKQARQVYLEEKEKEKALALQIEKDAMPAKVRKQYDDYEQVVTNENIDKLVRERPAWETTIKNDFNPHEAAYYLIKQAKFFKENKENKQNQERIESNNQKPVSSNTIAAKGPLSQANAFATQSKADLWAEMTGYAKKVNSVPEMR